MKLHAKVKRLCEEKNMTVKDLELALNITGISKWKTRLPISNNLLKVAQFFDVTTDYLLGHTTQDKVMSIDLTEEDEEYLALVKQLNLVGLHKLLDYIELLNESNRYKKEEL